MCMMTMIQKHTFFDSVLSPILPENTCIRNFMPQSYWCNLGLCSSMCYEI
jgi:hypothetical protein